jgi:hypothetical protein
MIARCANPACTTPFRYLHDGKLYVLILRGCRHPQYVWLCNACSPVMTVVPSEDGKGIAVVPRRPVSYGETIAS